MNEIEQSARLFQLHDAQVVRAGKTILHVDDFSLGCGENIAIVGPNGAGKSTFVNMITREVLPLYRENPPVRFLGNPRATLDQVKREVGIVSASMQSQIAVHLPAAEIVEGGLFGTVGLPSNMNLRSTDESRRRAFEALEMLGIASLADRDVTTLSSGQKRRVLIARALVHNPSTLLLDEPCTGLDPQGMYYVRSSMRRLARAGKGIILITHYPEDIMPEIGRLVLIKDGRLYADGPKEELLCGKVMSELFGVPLQVVRNGENNEYFSLVSSY